jgi:hypothetical protein
MKTNKSNKELTDQLKEDLKEVQTKEELDALVSSAGMELNDDELDAAAGGQISFPGDIPNPACCDGPGPYQS